MKSEASGRWPEARNPTAHEAQMANFEESLIMCVRQDQTEEN